MSDGSRSLDIVGRYSRNTGFELEGPAPALVALADLLEDSSEPSCRFAGVPRPAGPEPYEELVDGLIVQRTGGPVRIEKDGADLRLTGDPERLHLLAENLRFLAADDGSDHLHLEYHPDHFFLDPSAEPLILVRRE